LYRNPKRTRQIRQRKLRVPVHRKRDRRVAGERLGFLRMHPAAGEVRDELVPQRVKIKHAAVGVAVFDLRRFQVSSQRTRSC
jgi:hypothetical protein